MSFTMVPMLLAGNSIPPEVKRALAENRLRDAGKLLMKKHGLSCLEVSHLLNFSACERRAKGDPA